MDHDEVCQELKEIKEKVDQNTIITAKLVERCKWFMILISGLCATVYGLQFHVF